MKTCLFIGGPLNLRMCEVPDPLPAHITVSTTPPGTRDTMAGLPKTLEGLEHMYLRRRLYRSRSRSKAVHTFYVHAHKDSRDAMAVASELLL